MIKLNLLRLCSEKIFTHFTLERTEYQLSLDVLYDSMLRHP